MHEKAHARPDDAPPHEPAGPDDGVDPALEESDERDEPPLLARNEEWVHQRVDRLQERLPRRTGKDRRTEGQVFDQQALMTLHKLLTSNVLRSVDFPISTGKEANVFRATTPQGIHLAVKIYRVNTSSFHRVLQYIDGDERFEGVSRDKRALVHAWAQKEFRNLERMRSAGVDVPEPVRVLNNVLVTEYVGVKEGPWPTLKELGDLPADDAQRFWQKLSRDFALIRAAGLVHADLSEFNILVENADRLGADEPPFAHPRIIDVGQAVLLTHPHAGQFVERDARNLVRYFRKQGVDCREEDLPGGEEE